MKLGSQKCQCAGCGAYFASTDAFDKHRAWRADQPKAMSNRRRECRDPADQDANTRVAARNALEWRMVARKNEDRAERAEAEVAELRATVEKVREIHQQHACTGYPDCMILFGGQCAHHGHCNHCRKTWPCPTIAALDGAGERQ